MKTSHFEGSIAYWAAWAAHGRDERTQRELAAFDFNFGGQRLVQPADCARTGHQPGDGKQVFAAGPAKTSHFDHRVRRKMAPQRGNGLMRFAAQNREAILPHSLG